MREIKFRAWDKEEDKMLYQVDDMVFIFGHDKNNVHVHSRNNYGDYTGDGYFNCEIMQYTGLHDKNGKEIYEGDIVKIKSLLKSERETIDIVQYWRDRFETKKIGIIPRETRIEVIGNIYENPNLLK